ncbi:DnaB-like helicase C-terminal domain-containing protein [Streptomyces sp. NPDC000927]|uniref:DnaB-like helicase C-terminal domain-containing protein n=1 Tax=Streptomyces sp. NPDC000927 TaxID=3154371 RepID=UPI003330ADF6
MCHYKDIAAAYGLSPSDLFDDAGDSQVLRQRKADLWMPCQGSKGGQIPCSGHKAAEYHYTDENDAFLFATCRCSRKGDGCKNPFAQWQKDPSKKSGKSWNLKGVRRVPYRLSALIAAVAEGCTIYVVEGEKDVDRLRSMGYAATSSPLGGGNWIHQFAVFFKGATVVVVADRDEKGFKHAGDVYKSLSGIAASITVVMSAVNLEGSDVSDHLDAGFTMDQLVPAVREDPVELVDPIPVLRPEPEVQGGSVLDPDVEALFAESGAEKTGDLLPEIKSGFDELVSDAHLPPGRTPVSDEGVERTVLGSMVFNPSLIELAVDDLTESDFTTVAHSAIFNTLMAMYAANIAIDRDTIAETMARNGTLRLINNDRDFLYELMGFHTDPDLMREHVQILVERSAKRKIGQILSDAQTRNSSDQWSSVALVEAATLRLQSVISNHSVTEKLSVADRLPGYVEQRMHDDEMPGLPSPWKELNEFVAFTPKRLLTVGAGTGGGKSLVAAQWAAHTAMKDGLPVLVVSMEMDAHEIMDRFVANMGGINLSRLGSSDLKGEKYKKLKRDQGEDPGKVQDFTGKFLETVDTMKCADHLWICDDGTVTTSKIRALVRSMDARGVKPALLVVDYIQLVTAEGDRLSEVQALTKISRDLKRIAMDFELCVLSVAQFNRDTKGREPTVQDFKGASAVEQDSDIILIMHQEINPETLKPVDDTRIEMIVAKNRNGQKGRRITLAGQQHYARLSEMGSGV